MNPKTTDAIIDDPDGSIIRSGTAVITQIENSTFVTIGQGYGTQYQFDNGALTGLNKSFGKIGQIVCRPPAPTVVRTGDELVVLDRPGSPWTIDFEVDTSEFPWKSLHSYGQFGSYFEVDPVGDYREQARPRVRAAWQRPAASTTPKFHGPTPASSKSPSGRCTSPG